MRVKKVFKWAVVVAQLAERSLPIPEVRRLNPVIGKMLLWTYVTVRCWKDALNEKEAANGPFKKKCSEWDDKERVKRKKKKETQRHIKKEKESKKVQCDQMARLLFNILPFSAMIIWQIAYKNGQSMVKILPNAIWTLSKWPKFFNFVVKWQNFAKSGHTGAHCNATKSTPEWKVENGGSAKLNWT